MFLEKTPVGKQMEEKRCTLNHWYEKGVGRRDPPRQGHFGNDRDRLRILLEGKEKRETLGGGHKARDGVERNGSRQSSRAGTLQLADRGLESFKEKRELREQTSRGRQGGGDGGARTKKNANQKPPWISKGGLLRSDCRFWFLAIGKRKQKSKRKVGVRGGGEGGEEAGEKGGEDGGNQMGLRRGEFRGKGWGGNWV